MIEKDPKTGLWRHPQPVSKDSLNNTDEMIDNFVAECERQAAKLEITVDYYIKEFIYLSWQVFIVLKNSLQRDGLLLRIKQQRSQKKGVMNY